MNGPRVALRGVRSGRWTGDLLFYDDVLALVPVKAVTPEDPESFAVAALLAMLFGRRERGRRARREQSPATLPRRARLVLVADVRSVVVEPRGYGAATLTIDGREYSVPKAATYREPWDRLLGPLFGDRLTVV